MKCSIIIPVYNSEKTLDRCLKSALKGHENIKEIIIIDDGSIDKSLSICNKYAEMYSNIKVIHTENKGVSSARNTGIFFATGDYIIFLDSDDELTNVFYSTLTSVKFQDLVVFDFYKMNKDHAVYVSIAKLANKSGYLKDHIEYHPRVFGCIWGKLYRTDKIKNIMFNESISLCEDAEFNLRYLSKCTDVIYFSIPMYYYHESSTIHKYSPLSVERYLYALNVLSQKIKDSNNLLLKSSYYEFMCNVYNVINVYSIFSHQNKDTYNIKCRLADNVRNTVIIDEILQQVDFSRMSLKHYIVAKCSQYRLYFILFLISLATTKT